MSLFLFYSFTTKTNFVIIVYISSIESFSNTNYEREAHQHPCHHRPVHPGVADVPEKEHAEVDDAHDGPEEGHDPGHHALPHRVGNLPPELQEEWRAGEVNGAAGYGGDVELGQGEGNDFHD